MIKILMTSKNKPKEKMVIGMVSRINMGLIKLLSKPSTAATKIAVRVLSICTPLKR
jgi:hypothetical protein